MLCTVATTAAVVFVQCVLQQLTASWDTVVKGVGVFPAAVLAVLASQHRCVSVHLVVCAGSEHLTAQCQETAAAAVPSTSQHPAFHGCAFHNWDVVSTCLSHASTSALHCTVGCLFDQQLFSTSRLKVGLLAVGPGFSMMCMCVRLYLHYWCSRGGVCSGTMEVQAGVQGWALAFHEATSGLGVPSDDSLVAVG